MTTGALLAELADELGDRAEAKWIVSHVTGRSPAALRASLEDDLPDRLVDDARRLAQRCRAGEPLQYVVGSWAFRSLELAVDPSVLIPRPETEQVTGVALDLLCGLSPAGERPVVADLGTGSGAIALSLAAESPMALDVWATDISEAAIGVAARNLGSMPAPGATVRLAVGWWYDALPQALRGGLDLVVSNPPYVSEPEFAQLDASVRDHEPYGALVAGPLGTEMVDVVVAGAPQWLAPAGALVVEIGAGQAVHARAAAEAAGLGRVEVRPDLTGRDRILVAFRDAL